MHHTQQKMCLVAQYLDKVLELLLAVDLLQLEMDDSFNLHVLGHQLLLHRPLHILKLLLLPASNPSVCL